jgi:hypothetical protein
MDPALFDQPPVQSKAVREVEPMSDRRSAAPAGGQAAAA